ncbi:MAG: thymidine phosphorylase [Defluviitaleaceae bacterium]|nr:thymidine phosphorylase [Defluviitaleaceae bacterium]
MNAFKIIQKKKQGQALTRPEIDFMVAAFCDGFVCEGQMTALLMAICINGFSREETTALTLAMVNSGDVLDFSGRGWAVADKHSTGGVGDKLTLTVTPMAAALGVYMAKMSGRSLGHTGGTINKLEAIPGFKADLPNDLLMGILESHGLFIASQTANLAPADKKIYALRDKTATVDSPALIAASVMSKKIAAGADAIVLDVKVGSGAFMKTLEDARHLAQIMVDIGKDCGRKVAAVLTAMDAPLGNAVGDGVEVLEAIDVLNGAGPDDIRELSVQLTAQIYSLAKDVDVDAARKLAEATLADGMAFEKFQQMVKVQGGQLDEIAKTPSSPFVAPQTGYIFAMDGEICGMAAHLVDGITFHKKLGNWVEQGEVLALIHGNNPKTPEMLAKAYTFAQTKPTPTPLIYEIIR